VATAPIPCVNHCRTGYFPKDCTYGPPGESGCASDQVRWSCACCNADTCDASVYIDCGCNPNAPAATGGSDDWALLLLALIGLGGGYLLHRRGVI